MERYKIIFLCSMLFVNTVRSAEFVAMYADCSAANPM